ncbi:MAG: universal stress protein UspA-like protein [Chloroflexi bacterium]|jgi:nucleotide-binding universal stress UspA family protein|nr:universal stress protein UspA-like protein [Chloroflexota bacterium]
MHEVILTCVDGSSGGYAAVAEAAELARRFNARLIALSVEEGLPRYAAIMGEVDEFKREKDAYFETVGHEAARIAGEHGAKLTHETRLGHAADAIVRFVEEVGADLVVLGYQGHSRIASFVIGTTAQKVNAYSRASVLIVKPTTPPADHGAAWTPGPRR